jgi:hypothetical protein
VLKLYNYEMNFRMKRYGNSPSVNIYLALTLPHPFLPWKSTVSEKRGPDTGMPYGTTAVSSCE